MKIYILIGHWLPQLVVLEFYRYLLQVYVRESEVKGTCSSPGTESATIPSFYRSLFHSPHAAPEKSEISAEATCAKTISEIQVYQKESVQEP